MFKRVFPCYIMLTKSKGISLQPLVDDQLSFMHILL